jgi:uncharacterized membrane protein YgdD (TMEM256/DUF423 family)
MSANASARRNRGLAAIGALLAGGAVAVAAYAAHGAEGLAQARLQTAAAFAFGHGLALAALAERAERRLDRSALYVLLAGTALFCGGVVAGTLFGAGSVVAPLGGGLLIAGWLLCAVGAVRG